mmetsp:Transcript_50542/g.114785  ORF Transcript_50542/g.114785 Transcript_50542/m.114785 type:complete len:224 (+) Transcript_50542:561-1232(+)
MAALALAGDLVVAAAVAVGLALTLGLAWPRMAPDAGGLQVPLIGEAALELVGDLQRDQPLGPGRTLDQTQLAHRLGEGCEQVCPLVRVEIALLDQLDHLQGLGVVELQGKNDEAKGVGGHGEAPEKLLHSRARPRRHVRARGLESSEGGAPEQAFGLEDLRQLPVRLGERRQRHDVCEEPVNRPPPGPALPEPEAQRRGAESAAAEAEPEAARGGPACGAEAH